MTDLSDLRARLGVKTISAGPPVYSDGQLGDKHTNTATGEVFTKVDVDLWRGTLGNVVAGIDSPSNADLDAMYTMDSADISGSVLTDVTGSGNDMTISGAVGAAGKLNECLSFDGINDRVFGYNTAATMGANTWSAIGWVKTGGGSNSCVVGRWDGATGINNRSFTLFHLSSGDFQLFFSQDGLTNSNQLSTANTYGDDQWHMVYIAFDHTTGTGYLNIDNGADSNSWATGYTALFVPASQEVVFGALSYPRAPVNHFNGELDQWRFFTRLLTTTEIATLYNGGIGA